MVWILHYQKDLKKNRELKHQRFWATYVNRKWVFSLLIFFGATKFVLLRVSTIIETICPNVCSKSQLKSAKSLLPVDVRRSKTSLFKLPTHLPRQRHGLVLLVMRKIEGKQKNKLILAVKTRRKSNISYVWIYEMYKFSFKTQTFLE